MFICSRCKKEFGDNEFNCSGMCTSCISLGQRVEKISDDIIVIGKNTWIRISGAHQNRCCVINTEDFWELFHKHHCTFDLVLNEEDHYIYLYHTDKRFGDFINECFGVKRKVEMAQFDFRRQRF